MARQAVEPFVLDLPAGAADPGDLRHIVGRDLQAGEERVRVGALAVTLDHELDPAASAGQAAAEAFEGGEGALRAQGVEALGEEVGEQVGGEAGEEVADLVVTGDGLHAEEGVTVGAAGLFLHAALEVEEGGGLEEEGSEGAGGGIGDGIALVGAAAAAWRKLCRRESRMESKTRATFYVRKRRSQS